MKFICLLFFIGVSGALPALADPPTDILSQFPQNLYIVGRGEVKLSGDIFKDKRRAEILARANIAEQLRYETRGATVDIVCEGKTSKLFSGVDECRNVFSRVIEVTFDEFLVGSRIVKTGEDGATGTYYALAILPKKEALTRAANGFEESLGKVRDFLNEARVSNDQNTRRGHINKAKEEFLKGLAYDGERSALENARLRATDLFEKLADEINELSLVKDRVNPTKR